MDPRLPPGASLQAITLGLECDQVELLQVIDTISTALQRAQEEDSDGIDLGSYAAKLARFIICLLILIFFLFLFMFLFLICSSCSFRARDRVARVSLSLVSLRNRLTSMEVRLRQVES